MSDFQKLSYYRDYITVVICLCLILLSTTTIRVLASPQLESLEQQAHQTYDNGNFSKAISLLKQAIRLDPKNPSILTNLGSALGEISNYTGALSLYKQALNISPHHIGALLGVGLVTKRLGDNSTSTTYLKDAITQPIISNDSEMIQAEKLEKAMSLVYLGNYSRSIDIADQILKQDPTNLEGLEIKTMSLAYLGKYDAALNLLNTLIAEGHNIAWILDERGVVLLNLNNYIGAIANFNEALTLEPNDAYAYFNRDLTILNQDLSSQHIDSLSQLTQHHQITFNHLDAALQDLTKVLSINPHNTDTLTLKTLLIEGLKQQIICGDYSRISCKNYIISTNCTL